MRPDELTGMEEREPRETTAAHLQRQHRPQGVGLQQICDMLEKRLRRAGVEGPIEFSLRQGRFVATDLPFVDAPDGPDWLVTGKGWAP